MNTNSRYLHPNIALLAKRLVSLLPDPLEVVFFVNSGSEANDLALRLARAYSGTKNTIVVDRAYHGHTLAVTEISPYKYENTGELKLVPNGPFKTPGPHIWKVSAILHFVESKRLTAYIQTVLGPLSRYLPRASS